MEGCSTGRAANSARGEGRGEATHTCASEFRQDKGESYCDAESTGENIKHPKLNKSHHKAERGDEQWGG